MLTGVLWASTASSAFLIARKIVSKYNTASLTRPMSPSTMLGLSNVCKSEKSGLQKGNFPVSVTSSNNYINIQKTRQPRLQRKLSYDLHLPKKLSNDPFIFAVFRWEASIMCKNMDQEHHYICWIISIWYPLHCRISANSSFDAVILDKFGHIFERLYEKCQHIKHDKIRIKEWE